MGAERRTVLEATSHPHAKQVSSVREGSVNRIFAVRIAQVRTERGWSYEQLARRLDIAKQDAFRICNGGKASVDQLSVILCAEAA